MGKIGNSKINLLIKRLFSEKASTRTKRKDYEDSKKGIDSPCVCQKIRNTAEQWLTFVEEKVCLFLHQISVYAQKKSKKEAD